MPVTPEAILDIVAEEASISREALAPEATLESLGVASIDVVSVIFTLEDRFGLILETEDVKGAQTVQDFVDAVMAKSAAA